MTTLTLDRPLLRTALLDVLLCSVAVAVPTLSHAAAFPLYLFDPMRLLVFAAILFSARGNALALALALPLLSWLTGGHPVFPKFVLIQGELALNVIVFHALWRRWGRFLPAAALSVVAAKGVYYMAKFLLLRAALLDGSLVATAWIHQFVTLSVILIAGGLVFRGRPRARS